LFVRKLSSANPLLVPKAITTINEVTIKAMYLYRNVALCAFFS